jgi:hypothetical protein
MLNFNSFTDRIMETGSEEEKWEKLDAEFDHFVVDMKPFVLKLPHRSGKIALFEICLKLDYLFLSYSCYVALAGLVFTM